MWCKGKEEGSHLFDKWGPHSKLRRRGRGKNIFFSFLLFLYFCMSVGRSVGFCLQYTQGGPGHISSRSIWQDRVSAVAAVPNSWKATEAFSIFINGDFGQNSILFSSSGSGGQGWQQDRIKPPFKGFIFHTAPSPPSPTSICSNMLRISRLRNMSPPKPPQFTARTERERERTAKDAFFFNLSLFGNRRFQCLLVFTIRREKFDAYYPVCTHVRSQTFREGGPNFFLREGDAKNLLREGEKLFHLGRG